MNETLTAYFQLFVEQFKNFLNYFIDEVTFNTTPWYINYFWWLIILSLVVWGLEILFPWRKNQGIFRKDFWLDTFYMFFNYYLFKLMIFFAFSCVIEKILADMVGGLDKLVIYDTSQLHPIIQLLVFFVLIDFVGWATIFYYIESIFYGVFTKYIIQQKNWVLQLILECIGWKMSFTPQQNSLQ